MMKTFIKLLTLTVLSLLTTGVIAQTTYHVNVANITPGDGTTWGAAFTTLQAALDVAVSGDEIRVAKGIYKPETIFAPGVTSPGDVGPNNRYNTFQLKSGVALYGGYDDQGNGTRDIAANETILSGDIGTENVNTDNAYNVIMIVAGTTGVVLDGFTITEGYANGGAHNRSVGGATHYPYYGGGIYLRNSDGTFRNLKITKNGSRTNSSATYGGGFFLSTNSTNLVELDNIEFVENEVATGGSNAHGGALYIAGSNIKLNRLKFIRNTAQHTGGAIFAALANTDLTISNAVFYDNTANSMGFGGGAIYLTSSGSVTIAANIVNSTFYKNTAANIGGAIYLVSSANISLALSNSILLDNTATSGIDIYKGDDAVLTLANSITQGVTGTNVNSTATAADVFINPSLTDYTDSDFLRLKPVEGNPAINTGDDSKYDLVLYGTDDLAGVGRFNGTVDLGAYENHTTLPVTLSAPLSAKASGSSVVLAWATATETNNSHFLLQRSTDGENFTQIANVPSKGNGATYSHTDFSPANGTSYYRLVQVDNDGEETIYGPVSINISLNAESGISVYPNPVQGHAVAVSFGGHKINSLQVLNLQGQVLQTVTIVSGATESTVNVTTYPKGIYFIRLIGESGTVTKKVVKL